MAFKTTNIEILLPVTKILDFCSCASLFQMSIGKNWILLVTEQHRYQASVLTQNITYRKLTVCLKGNFFDWI